MRDDNYWGSGLPTYSGQSVFDIGWLALIVSTALCLITSRLENTEERIIPTKSLKDAANPDTGKCAQCGQLNSTMASRCHACYAILPWVKPAKAQVAKTPKAAATQSATASVDLGSWFQSAGGSTLTFIFCCAAPFLGFFLWRYMDKEDSPYTGVACVGWILGIVFHVGRFGWKAVQVGSSLN